MNQFICLFLPALLSFTKKDSSKAPVELLKKYASNTIIINFIVMLVVCAFHYLKNDFGEDFTFQFTLKYLALACVIAKVLPSFRTFIRKNIKIEIRRENRQKNSKRH